MSDALRRARELGASQKFYGGGSSSSTTSTFSPFAPMAMDFASILEGQSQALFNDVLVGQELPLLFGITDPQIESNLWAAGNNQILASPWTTPGAGISGSSVQTPGFLENLFSPGNTFTGGVGTPSTTFANVVPSTLAQFGAPGAIMAQAFDPQQALYHQQLGQLQQGIQSELGQTGLGNTPYGAAAMGNALSNFNIDWQNNLLNREITGVDAAANLYNSLYSGSTGVQQPIEAGLQGLTSLAQSQNVQQTNSSSSGGAGQIAQQAGGALSSLAGIGK